MVFLLYEKFTMTVTKKLYNFLIKENKRLAQILPTVNYFCILGINVKKNYGQDFV